MKRSKSKSRKILPACEDYSDENSTNPPKIAVSGMMREPVQKVKLQGWQQYSSAQTCTRKYSPYLLGGALYQGYGQETLSGGQIDNPIEDASYPVLKDDERRYCRLRPEISPRLIRFTNRLFLSG